MNNLLKETMLDLKNNNKTLDDILWVGTETLYFSKEHFIEIANKEYHGGYGSQEVAINLKVVGENWWLERHEYDGSEWWEYKEYPTKPNKEYNPKTVIMNGYGDSLEEIIEE